jgi:hypothetical protein
MGWAAATPGETRLEKMVGYVFTIVAIIGVQTPLLLLIWFLFLRKFF